MEKNSYIYTITQQGNSHKGCGKSNEDCIIARRIKRDKAVIVAADGVSASKRGGDAADFIAHCFYELLMENLKRYKEYESFEEMIEKIATATLSGLTLYSAIHKESLSEFAATLEVGLFWKDKVYYFHSGDGAIFSLRKDGFVDQTSIDGHTGETAHSVIPFSEKRYWEIGVFNNSLGMTVMTDGVYELIRPLNIRKHGYEYEPSIFIPIIDRRCHNKSKKRHLKYVRKIINGLIRDEEAIEKLKVIQNAVCKEESNYKTILEDHIVTNAQKSIQDDMSIGVYVKELPKCYKEGEEPDYETIRKLDFEKAYPHLVFNK